MIRTNLRTCADNEIARQDGNGVQARAIIVASLNGYSVMEKMIVAMVQMSCRNIVQNVRQKLISNAAIIDAYQSKYFEFYKHFLVDI